MLYTIFIEMNIKSTYILNQLLDKNVFKMKPRFIYENI